MARFGPHVVRLFAALCLIVAMVGALPGRTMVGAQVVPLGEVTSASATVIAQGVTTPPDGDAAWRVVRSSGGARDDQDPVSTTTGFVVAGADALLISDLDTEGQTLLGPGEAAWVAGGTEQQRAALDDDPVSYTELSLVPEADADEAGEGEIVFAGDGFDASDDSRKIELQAATLEADQSLEIAVANGESVVLVAGGMVSVSSGGDLASGDAQTYDDDVTLTNEGDDLARVYVASIGAVVPPLPVFTGSATLQVRACPDGSTGSTFVPSTCTPVDADDGFVVGLLDANYQLIDTDDPLQDGEQTWDDLEFGTYPWAAPTLPAPYVGTLWTDTESAPLDIAQATIGADELDITHILYVFPVTVGTITVTIANCPAGVTPDTLQDAICDAPVSGNTSLAVTTPDGDSLDAGDGSGGGGQYTFTLDVDNAAGAFFTVDQPRLPNGYDDYLVTGAGTGELNGPLTIALTSASPVVNVTIFNFRPESAASASPSPSSSSGSGTGSLTLQVIGCPVGVQRGQAASYNLCTTPVGGGSAILITPSGATLSAGGPGGVYSFGDLAYGTYSLGLTGLPPGYSGAVAPGFNTSGGDADRVDVTVSADNDSPVVTVLVFQ